MFNIKGKTLDMIIRYMHRHLEHPALHLFRYEKQPSKCLGAERLAKRALRVMKNMGIDTEVYKAHSLRGATATHMLAQGVPIEQVQSRGHWSSQKTLGMYYNRLHLQLNWEDLLGENAREGIALGCAVPTPTPST